jgi:hypothetical protein
LALNLSLALMFCAFCSGWFHINKLAIETYKEQTEEKTVEQQEEEQKEITKNSIKNIKQFFTGVGDNFLKNLGGYTILLLLNIVVLFIVIKICIVQYGLIQIPEVQSVKEIIEALTQEDKITLSKWIITIIPISFLFQYFFVLYNASLYFDKKNIFVALLDTAKFFFKNFWLNIGLLILLPIIKFIISAPAQVIGANTIGVTLNIIASTIYFTFYTIIIFRLYSEKTKINCDNRTEFSGEDSAIDSTI